MKKRLTIKHSNLFLGSSENSSQTIQVAEPYVRKVQLIQERFVKALQIHLSHFEDGPKLTEIFTWFKNLGLKCFVVRIIILRSLKIIIAIIKPEPEFYL